MSFIRRFYKQFIEPFPAWFDDQANRLSDAADDFTDWFKSLYIDTDEIFDKSTDVVTQPGKDYVKEFMESPWTEDKYSKYLMLRETSTLGPYFKAYEAMEDNRQYMARYGLSWNDTKFVWRLPGTNQASSSSYSMVFGSLNFVSSNLRRLYR